MKDKPVSPATTRGELDDVSEGLSQDTLAFRVLLETHGMDRARSSATAGAAGVCGR